MTTTTPGAIRDVIIARIEGLTPPTHGAVKFRPHREDDLDLRTWAEANPTACLRKFTVETAGTTEPVEVTMVTLEQVRESMSIVIAYPADGRHGSGRLGLADTIASDLRHIDYYAGTTGFSITPTSNATIISKQYDRETGPAVIYGVIPLEVIYWRAAP